MANKLLNGTNWSTAGDWSPANAPVTADDVRVLDSPRDIITGDQSTVHLGSLLVPARYNGSFGTSGAPLKITCAKVDYRGRGGFFYESGKTAGALRTEEIRIDAADSAVRVELGSKATDAAFMDHLILSRGNILIKGNAAFDTVTTPLVEVMKEATVTISSGITNPLTDYRIQGGNSKCDSVITNLRLVGGEHTQDTAKISIGDVHNGTLIYNHAAVSGDGTILRIWDGGVLVLDGNMNAKTVTTVWLFPGSRMIPSKVDGINWIITNLYDLRR